MAKPPSRILKFCSSSPSACLTCSNSEPSRLLGSLSSIRALICHPLAEVWMMMVSLLVGERSTR